MYTQLLHSAAQQHIDDLRSEADHGRLVAQATPERPGLGLHAMRIARRAAQTARRRLAVTFSTGASSSGLAGQL